MLQSFPPSHSCHSVTGCKLYTCKVAAGPAPPAAMQRHAWYPPTRQHPPWTGGLPAALTPQHAPVRSPRCPAYRTLRPLMVTSAKRCPTRSASPVAPRPVVLLTSSTGAWLRCALAIWPLRVWRRVLLH